MEPVSNPANAPPGDVKAARSRRSAMLFRRGPSPSGSARQRRSMRRDPHPGKSAEGHPVVDAITPRSGGTYTGVARERSDESVRSFRPLGAVRITDEHPGAAPAAAAAGTSPGVFGARRRPCCRRWYFRSQPGSHGPRRTAEPRSAPRPQRNPSAAPADGRLPRHPSTRVGPPCPARILTIPR